MMIDSEVMGLILKITVTTLITSTIVVDGLTKKI